MKLREIYGYKQHMPSYGLFAEIIETGLQSPPMPFDETWLNLTQPPFINVEPHPDNPDNLMIDSITNLSISKFEVLEKTLMFQIADLKSMEGVVTETIYYGDISGTLSPAGNEWYSNDLICYLNSAVSSFADFNETECDWLTLTDMLEYGRTGFIT